MIDNDNDNDNDNFRAMLVHLGFNQDNQSVASVMRRSYGANNFELLVDFSNQKIIYPTGHGFKIHQAQTCNFSSSENAVVLECVHRLFEKGYKPEHIELKPQWKLGHGGKSGRADILVRDQQGIALLLIECKTAGREFDKAWKDTLADGAQLFSYVEQEKATQFVCLYASEFDTKKQSISLSQKIISVKDNTKILDDNPKALAFNAATNAKERFKVWKETYLQEYTETGLFESNIQPYQIGKNKYTLQDDTKPLEASDIKGAYHRFRTILRKHNVSRRENAFEVLVNLFLCKIVDELENPDDLKFYWKGIAYDNYFDLVDRLQSLYKIGMERFLAQDIVYISNDEIDAAFWAIKQKRNATKARIKEIFRELKFYKGLDFEFIKVFNKAYFDKNAKILLEIIQMWQCLRLTGSGQNQFLGDMFEYFLDNGIKQSEGQFFTPVPICKFVVSRLPLEQLITQHNEPLRAIDYACGSGHFLTEYAQQLPALLQTHKNLSDPSSYYAHIYGIEKEDRLAKVVKVSAFMYGFKDIQVIDADALVPHASIKEQGFQLLVANPPFAVEDFLLTVPADDRERFALLRTVSDMGNRNVQCFFLEPSQQLLAPGGVMGVIVPSSILSNTDGMHIATRELLLKYFDFVSIAELGGQTFGKTGTNTVVLFLRRKAQRPEPAEHYWNRTLDFFENWQSEAQSGGGAYQDLDVVRHYCAHAGLDFDAYQSLLTGQPSDALRQADLFKDYHRAFDASTEVRKLKDNRAFSRQPKESQEADLAQRFTHYCVEVEKAKLYHFMLAHNNPTPVLLVKPPADNKLQKQFLGYEWSGAKGSEGIQYSHGDTVQDIRTPLFDPLDRDNAEKISHLIRQNFEGKPLAIPESLQPFVTQAKLVDLLEFGRVEFDVVLSATAKNTLTLSSQWPLFKMEDLMTIGRGASPRPIKQFLTTDADGVNWIKIGDVAAGEKYITQTEEKITVAGAVLSRSVKEGDFILSNSMSFGRPYILKIQGCIHDGWLLLTDIDARLDKKYLYEILSYEETQKQFQQQAGGGVVQNLNADRVRSVKIPIPPLSIQQQIVTECEAVDAAVEQARTVIAQKYKEISELIEQGSQLGTLTKKLADVCDLKAGKFVAASAIKDTSAPDLYPCYGGNGLRGYTKTFTHDGTYPLIGRQGALCGNVHLVTGQFHATEHAVVVTPFPQIDTTWLFHKLTGLNLNQYATGVAQPGLSVERLKTVTMELPSLSEQQKITAAIKLIAIDIATAQATIAAAPAPAQKQAILQKYL
jgi:type I restriction enzyme M protein